MNYFKNLLKLERKEIFFFTFIVVYLVFGLYLCNIINIWEDEAYSLNTSSLDLPGVIRQSYHFEGQPPVYFIVLALWRLISPGIFFARLLSLFFVGFAALFFLRIVCIASGNESYKWLVIIFLLNPFTVWAALEIRPYALLIFLSTISIYYFLLYVIENKKKYLYYFLLISFIGIYTQYFFVFLIATLAFSLFIYRGWRAFYSFCLYLIPLVILFIPNLLFISEHLAMAHSDNPNYSIIERFTLGFKTVQNILLAINLFPTEKLFRWSIRIIFFFLFVFTYIKQYNKRHTTSNFNFKKINAIIIMNAIIVILFTIYLIITGIKFNDRYMAIEVPLLIMLFMIFKEYTPLIRNIIFGTISLYFVSLLIYKYSNPIKTYDYQSFAIYVSSIAHIDEPIVLNSNTISAPFEYYYTGSSPLIPLPDTFKLTENGFQLLIKDTIELKQLLGSIRSDSKSILFINDNLVGYSCDLKLTTEMMDKCLNAQYKITLDTTYYGKSRRNYFRIRRLEYKSRQ